MSTSEKIIFFVFCAILIFLFIVCLITDNPETQSACGIILIATLAPPSIIAVVSILKNG